MLLLYINMDIINLIIEIKEKITQLENLITDNGSTSNNRIKLKYVDLKSGTNEEKLRRIVEQIEEYNINILPTAEDSNIVRSAIVATLGESGCMLWTKIRSQREDYDLHQQIIKYINLLKYRENNTMTFGAIINRYITAIDKYNSQLN